LIFASTLWSERHLDDKSNKLNYASHHVKECIKYEEQIIISLGGQMADKDKQNETFFSKKWVLFSLIIYLAIEIILGGYVSQLLSGTFVSRFFIMKIELLLMLISYFIGGFLIGLISPTVRIFEPAVGAFLAVAFTFLYGMFTPLRFFGFSLSKILIGGGIAFVLALVGAEFGEKLAARLGNKKSQNFIKQ